MATDSERIKELLSKYNALVPHGVHHRDSADLKSICDSGEVPWAHERAGDMLSTVLLITGRMPALPCARCDIWAACTRAGAIGGGPLQGIRTGAAIALCEASNRYMRFIEERQLLLLEMRQYIAYFQGRIEECNARQALAQSALGRLPAASSQVTAPWQCLPRPEGTGLGRASAASTIHYVHRRHGRGAGWLALACLIVLESVTA